MGCVAPEKVQEAFLAAPPLIAEQILDLTIKHPNWMRDVFQMREWPKGNGTVMEQLIFRGAMPQIERGFDKWTKMGNLSGCDPCAGPNCSYNWTPFGGHGFDRKLTELMKREFKSPAYCVEEIQTTAHFEQVFGKIVENLYAQVDFFREQNIGLNFLTSLAKKYVVDSEGPKPNTQNPYVYRNTGGVRLSTLNINLLEFFYEQMRRMPDAIPYDVVDGSPIFALEASPQTLARLYRDDPELRQDARFSGLANDLLMKYNFMSTLRGMFIPAPILYPRRFNIVAGEPIEVLPFINDAPAEVGAFTYVNEAYNNATHEEVLIHGKYPFEIFYFPTAETLGDGSSFGPEFAFMNQWMWVNPQTDVDPFRRVGFFATSAKIALSQQFSEAIFGVLIERPLAGLTAFYTPNPVCPVAPPTCTNVVPDVLCPCPVVMSITANPLTAGNYYFQFSTPVTGEAEDPVQLQLDNGAFITGALVALSDDGLTAEITFTTDLPEGICTAIIGIYCDSSLGCSASVQFATDCRSGATNAVKLILSNPIKAIDVNDIVIAYFGDCTQAELKVLAVDAANLTWTVGYNTGFGPTDNPTGAGGPPPTNAPLNADMLCDRGGITKLCVPPATDATCPACGPDVTACENPDEG
jgi:hypothetical protein